MFDVIRKVWKEHFFFEDEVFRVCRNEQSETDNDLGVYL